MRHLFYLHNLRLPDKVAAQKKRKIKNKIPVRLYIYFPDGEKSNNKKEEFLVKDKFQDKLIQNEIDQ